MYGGSWVKRTSFEKCTEIHSKAVYPREIGKVIFALTVHIAPDNPIPSLHTYTVLRTYPGDRAAVSSCAFLFFHPALSHSQRAESKKTKGKRGRCFPPPPFSFSLCLFSYSIHPVWHGFVLAWLFQFSIFCSLGSSVSVSLTFISSRDWIRKVLSSVSYRPVGRWWEESLTHPRTLLQAEGYIMHICV